MYTNYNDHWDHITPGALLKRRIVKYDIKYSNNKPSSFTYSELTGAVLYNVILILSISTSFSLSETMIDVRNFSSIKGSPEWADELRQLMFIDYDGIKTITINNSKNTLFEFELL